MVEALGLARLTPSGGDIRTRPSFGRFQDRQSLVSGKCAALDSCSSRALRIAGREELDQVAAAAPADTEPAEPDRQVFDVQSRPIQVHSVPQAETYVITDKRLNFSRAAFRRSHRSPLSEPPEMPASTSRRSILAVSSHREAPMAYLGLSALLLVAPQSPPSVVGPQRRPCRPTKRNRLRAALRSAQQAAHRERVCHRRGRPLLTLDGFMDCHDAATIAGPHRRRSDAGVRRRMRELPTARAV